MDILFRIPTVELSLLRGPQVDKLAHVVIYMV